MSTQTPNLCKAMAQAFPKIEGALKESKNPHYGSKYADFSSVVDAVKPALTSHGLFFMQHIRPADGAACVETVLYHESGESLPCGLVSVPVTKNDAQGYGSALTYARRYSLSAALGVAPEDVGAPKDDDGTAACGKGPKAEKAPAKSLAPEVLKTLAAEVLANLVPLIEKGKDSLDLLERYLAYWQSVRPGADIRSLVEKSVSEDPGKFLEKMQSWSRRPAA